MMIRTKKETKRLFFIWTAIMSLTVFLVVSAYMDFSELSEKKALIEKYNIEYHDSLALGEKLKSEVTKFKDEDYVARYAKEKYMYSSYGETIIRMD